MDKSLWVGPRLAWTINKAGCIITALILLSGVKLLGFTLMQSLMIGVVCGPLIWLSFYLSQGLTLVPQNSFLVIERLEQYYRTANEGVIVLLFPNWIDRIAPNGGQGDYKSHKVDYQTDAQNGGVVNFRDDSAKVIAEIWYSIKKDAVRSLGSSQDNAPYRWVYAVRDSGQRIVDIIVNAARPLLQTHTIDEAQINLRDIEKEVTESPGVLASLDAIGVQLDPNRGFLIKNIELPPETVRARRLALEGHKEAERQIAVGEGYANSILAIVRLAKAQGEEISFDQARAIYEYQRGLEQLGKTGANISFVNPDIRGVMIALGMKK